jgi:hypothetical protein
MIQLITSPDIISNNKLAKKISKQLDIYKVNIKDIVYNNENLNQCLIELNLLLEKHKRLIIYGQCIDYYNKDSLINQLTEYIMTNYNYQIVIHNLKTDEQVIKEILNKHNNIQSNNIQSNNIQSNNIQSNNIQSNNIQSNNIHSNNIAVEIKEAIYKNVEETEPYMELNRYHRLRRFDSAIVM